MPTTDSRDGSVNEVEITEGMIRAGVEAFASSGLETADAQTEALVSLAICEVFREMVLAKRIEFPPEVH
jgi:hypothetical protein